MGKTFVHSQKSCKYNIMLDEALSGNNLLEFYKMLNEVIVSVG